MTFLNRSVAASTAPVSLLNSESRPSGRTLRRLSFWGGMLVVFHIIYQLLLQYPTALKSLVPELWWNLLAGGAIELMILALLIPLLLKRDGLSLSDLGFAPTQWKEDCGRGALAGTVIWLLHTLLLRLAMVWTGGLNINTGMIHIVAPMSNGSGELFGVILSIVVMGPLTEEVLYRGCLMASTRACFGTSSWTAVLAIALSGITFALVHALGHPFYSVIYFVTGLAFALVYQRTGSLAVSVFAHGTVNALAALYACIRIYHG